MIEALAIDHIVLRTTKLDEMLKFYTNVLNCTIEREATGESRLTQLRAGNALIDLVVVDNELQSPGSTVSTSVEQNMDHFCLQITPVPEQEVISHFNKHNVEYGAFEKRNGAQGEGNSVYIKDPEGNGVELKFSIVK